MNLLRVLETKIKDDVRFGKVEQLGCFVTGTFVESMFVTGDVCIENVT